MRRASLASDQHNVALQPPSAGWNRWVMRLASCYSDRRVSRIFGQPLATELAR
jgi:hypothetical protein